MLKSTKGCRLKATDKTVMRGAKGIGGLTTGRIDKSAAMGERNSFSPQRKPLPAYKQTHNGRRLSAAEARAKRMRG
jgi:hypothetical protein